MNLSAFSKYKFVDQHSIHEPYVVCLHIKNLWVIFVLQRFKSVLLYYRFGPPSGKASASRAEDPGFEFLLCWDFCGVESYQ